MSQLVDSKSSRLRLLDRRLICVICAAQLENTLVRSLDVDCDAEESNLYLQMSAKLENAKQLTEDAWGPRSHPEILESVPLRSSDANIDGGGSNSNLESSSGRNPMVDRTCGEYRTSGQARGEKTVISTSCAVLGCEGVPSYASAVGALSGFGWAWSFSALQEDEEVRKGLVVVTTYLGKGSALQSMQSVRNGIGMSRNPVIEGKEQGEH
ncbi:hypothetical protein V8B97DRAFT_2107996 [Scleroderma yunnanense]